MLVKMNFFALFALSAAFVGSSIGYRLESLQGNPIEDRIIGGHTARPGQFPYLVSLRAFLNESSTVFEHLCGGTIISNRWILTAAHCTQNKESVPKNVIVIVGAHHFHNDGQIYYLDRIITHRFTKEPPRRDISVLRTKKTIQFNKNVQPIPLRRQNVGEGVTATISGWGLVKVRPLPIFPTFLQYAEMRTISTEECILRTLPDLQKYIYEATLCTFKLDKGSNKGDSGGPLTANGQLIGIVSWADVFHLGRPNGFSRISYFADWIQRVTGVVAV